MKGTRGEDREARGGPPRIASVVLRTVGLGMSFGPVRVLEDVSLELSSGEVHVLAGANGAGKSTLVRILAGVHPRHEGGFEVDGRRVRPATPREALELGIVAIHQELSLVRFLSVAENLVLGRAPARWGFRRLREERAWARRALARVGLEVDLDQELGQLPVAVQQQVEIARALDREARVLLMDEPTSALNERESEHLFELVDRLRRQGCAIVFITHRMEEIERLADRVSILRDGRLVGTFAAGELSPAALIERMLPRAAAPREPQRKLDEGPPLLAVRDLCVAGRRSASRPGIGVSFDVRRGEVLGFVGLEGAGIGELFHALFGALGRRARGSVFLEGEELELAHPADALARGLALVPRDRRAQGLVLDLSLSANATLASLAELCRAGWRRPRLERRRTRETFHAVGLHRDDLDAPVAVLSGGNQQKVVLARALMTRPRVLLLDDPTRGVDAGARQEFHARIARLAGEGVSILFTSSELSEVCSLADRILVLHRGAVTAEYARGAFDSRRLLAAAMGSVPGRAAP